jgi:hypothetical protein
MHLSTLDGRRPLRLAFLLPALALLSIGAGPARAESPPAAPGEKHVSGMSIVGNDEAPKSLVIVPWKSSDMGDTLDVTRDLDDELRPVDREVFSRELDYFEIRIGDRQ